jgi:hypothetical protein
MKSSTLALLTCALFGAVGATNPGCDGIYALPQASHPGVPQGAAETLCKTTCAQPGFTCALVVASYPTVCGCGGGTPTPAPAAGNECNPAKGCNVCTTCCASYVTDGAACDQCVKASCDAPTPAPGPVVSGDYCGTDYADANKRCHAPCDGTDKACLVFAGEHCFKTTACHAPPAPTPAPVPTPVPPPSPPTPHPANGHVSGLWVFLGDTGLAGCGQLADSIAEDFNVLSVGFVDPQLMAQGGGAATKVPDLLNVTKWAQAKGMSVVWSIGGELREPSASGSSGGFAMKRRDH